MLDRAPIHHKNSVRQQLQYFSVVDLLVAGKKADDNAQYRSAIVWPPHSPYFNPCDFFLLGVMKEQVYAKEVNNMDKPLIRINDVVDIIRQTPTFF